MTLKEQILEYLEVTDGRLSPLQITKAVHADYSKTREALFELREEGLVNHDFAPNTYYIAMDKEYIEGTELDKSNGDWIDEAARTLTPEQFRGAMLFKIGEHLHGIGKKEEICEEVKKVADYSRRWGAYEAVWLNK